MRVQGYKVGTWRVHAFAELAKHKGFGHGFGICVWYNEPLPGGLLSALNLVIEIKSVPGYLGMYHYLQLY